MTGRLNYWMFIYDDVCSKSFLSDIQPETSWPQIKKQKNAHIEKFRPVKKFRPLGKISAHLESFAHLERFRPFTWRSLGQEIPGCIWSKTAEIPIGESHVNSFDWQRSSPFTPKWSKSEIKIYSNFHFTKLKKEFNPV